MTPNLALAIRINEEIRQVIEASRQVNYVALNALLTARKAGARSRGFAVVARELRGLSHELEHVMQQLDSTVGNLVTAIASQIREMHLLDYVRATGSACTTVPRCMAAMNDSLQARVDRWQQRIDSDWLDLEKVFCRASRLSEMGSILSRSAKIEAAHGGEMSGLLILVSNQMESNVGAVLTRLRQLRLLIAS